MKKGFTLAELLITLGIVGVVAAVTIPTLAKLKPDNAKARYIKSYTVLTDVTADLVKDEGLFLTTYGAGGLDPMCVGLGCDESIDAVLQEYNLTKHKDDKYAYLLAWKLNALDTYSLSGREGRFTTKDGVMWTVTSNLNSSNGVYELSSEIKIDVDGTQKGKNCLFDTSCKNPDQFLFKVDTYGKVSPKDSLGKTFLKNQTQLQSNNKDRG